MIIVQKPIEYFQSGLLVHGCNAQGKYNAGVAKTIRTLYPSAYFDYMRRFDREGYKLGDIVFTVIDNDLTIASAITQNYYGRNPAVQYVDYNAIRLIFARLRRYCEVYSIDKIGFPKIGCQLGGGNWEIVKQIIEQEEHPGIEYICYMNPTP